MGLCAGTEGVVPAEVRLETGCRGQHGGRCSWGSHSVRGPLGWRQYGVKPLLPLSRVANPRFFFLTIKTCASRKVGLPVKSLISLGLATLLQRHMPGPTPLQVHMLGLGLHAGSGAMC